MKSLNRWVLMGLAILFTIGLTLAPASADTASKKKKKKEIEKKEEKKAEIKAERRAERKKVIDGANLSGKPGYIISDTASVLNQGQWMGGAHLAFDTWGSALQIPVGVSYGLSDKLMLNVNTSFFTAGGASGLYFLDFGGKYGWKNVGDTDNLNVAAGLDFAVGPLSNNLYGYSAFAFDPYGVVTYTFKNGLQLNGKLGLYVQSYSSTYTILNVSHTTSYSFSYFQLDLGVAYPFSKDLTGFGELATNGLVYNGAGGTPLLAGIRTGKDVQLQAFAGLDLGGAVGLFLGGGVVFISE